MEDNNAKGNQVRHPKKPAPKPLMSIRPSRGPYNFRPPMGSYMRHPPPPGMRQRFLLRPMMSGPPPRGQAPWGPRYPMPPRLPPAMSPNRPRFPHRMLPPRPGPTKRPTPKPVKPEALEVAPPPAKCPAKEVDFTVDSFDDFERGVHLLRLEARDKEEGRQIMNVPNYTTWSCPWCRKKVGQIPNANGILRVVCSSCSRAYIMTVRGTTITLEKTSPIL